MHYAGVLGKAIKDSQSYGWKFPQPEEKNEQQPTWIHPIIKVDHEWDKLREGVQNYIASLNWNYRVSLREKKVDYINAYAHFVSANTILTIDKKQKEHTYTAERFLLATGLRPRYPDIPGAKEYGITSDDLFSLKYSPGKTLCVGASYVSLECAGFLKQVGFEVDVMVRSILLRGFDQQMATMVGNNLEQIGVRFHKEYVPTSIEQVEAGQPGKLKVSFKKIGNDCDPDEIDSEEYNTVRIILQNPIKKTINFFNL
uniref:FAD/NAD(P)-binding domain-containing protein n=1 Tax=Strigamia maritima TaxID=126957 RepID=T1IZJ2_STRMM